MSGPNAVLSARVEKTPSLLFNNLTVSDTYLVRRGASYDTTTATATATATAAVAVDLINKAFVVVFGLCRRISTNTMRIVSPNINFMEEEVPWETALEK